MTAHLHTRIMLADDHAVVRRGLRLVLEGEPDLRVVAEAGDGAEAVERGLQGDVDLAVLDISMPRMTGLQAARQIRAHLPETQVLALSMHDDERYVFDALKAGASGYVLKREVDQALLNAIRAVNRGEAFLTNAVERTIVREWMNDSSSGPEEPLSPREQEVLKARAKTDLPNLAGTEEAKVAVLKAIDGIADEKLREEAHRVLKGANGVVKTSAPGYGGENTGGPAEVTKQSAYEALKKGLIEFCVEKKIDKPWTAGHAEFVKTSLGKQLNKPPAWRRNRPGWPTNRPAWLSNTPGPRWRLAARPTRPHSRPTMPAARPTRPGGRPMRPHGRPTRPGGRRMKTASRPRTASRPS